METISERKHVWIKERIAEGRTVYLSTALRVTKLTAKHLHLIRATPSELQVKHGGKWIDYSYARLSAQ